MATKKPPEEMTDEEREYEALTPAQKRVRQRPKEIPKNSTFAERSKKAKRVDSTDAQDKRVSSSKTKSA